MFPPRGRSELGRRCCECITSAMQLHTHTRMSSPDDVIWHVKPAASACFTSSGLAIACGVTGG